MGTSPPTEKGLFEEDLMRGGEDYVKRRIIEAAPSLSAAVSSVRAIYSKKAALTQSITTFFQRFESLLVTLRSGLSRPSTRADSTSSSARARAARALPLQSLNKI